MSFAFIVSTIIFVATFAVIVSERVHRTVIAFLGAVAMVVAGIALDFYHPEHAVHAVDVNTLGLLFGMMVIVAVMEKTGVFQYLGITVAQKTGGKPLPLFIALATLTSVLSLILDNVTTIILIVPITLVIARTLSINPLPLLFGEAILANVAGVGTLVGDPPNVMIGSAASLSFNDFLTHSLPVTIVVWIVTIIVMRIYYRDAFKQEPQRLAELQAMDAKEALTDTYVLKVCLGALAVVVALFLVHHTFHIPPSFVALIGAAITLIFAAPHKDPQEVLQHVELSVLLFFGSLFVIVGGLEHAGVLEYAAHFITGTAETNLVLTAIIILWVSAIISSIVDNIPFTVAMIPVIGYLGTQGVDVELLWWALAFGVGFGGNFTPIGSSVGVIVVSKSEKTDTPITFIEWMKVGGVATLAGLSATTVLIILFAPLLG